jgi:hypothetical protein
MPPIDWSRGSACCIGLEQCIVPLALNPASIRAGDRGHMLVIDGGSPLGINDATKLGQLSCC